MNADARDVLNDSSSDFEEPIRDRRKLGPRERIGFWKWQTGPHAPAKRRPCAAQGAPDWPSRCDRMCGRKAGLALWLQRAGQSLIHGGRVVRHYSEAFMGIDTSKSRNAVAIAEGGRGGEMRFVGEFHRGGNAVAR